MAKKEKFFSAGELLFRQGEPCKNVYTILDGQAELFVETNGRERIAGRKRADDVLGADDVLNGVYSASARAVGELTVQVATADEYIAKRQRTGALSPKDDSFAFDDDDDGFDFDSDDNDDFDFDKPVGKPASRAANLPDGEDEPPKKQALVKVERPRAPAVKVVDKPVVLHAEPKHSALADWLKEGTDGEVSFGTALVLASIDGDDDGAIRESLYQILRQIPNVRVKVVDGVIDDANGARAAMQMRTWMEAHAADFGLYARFDNAGRVLEFHAVRGGTVENNPFDVGTRFFLPVQMDDLHKTLLKAFTVGVLLPTRLEHEQLLHLFLPALLNEAGAYAAEPMTGLTAEEQGANLTCFANVLSLISLFKFAENKTALASEVYEKALTLLPPYAPEYVFVTRQVGLIHQLDGEQKEDIADFKLAEQAFQKAADAVSKKYKPEAYGDLKLRIGNVRQKIAFRSGNGEDFVSAMTAYRDSLSVLKPAKDADKWADAVNGLARTMQLFSSYSTKTTLLKKAVELYERELTVLDRDEKPLLWARASNNLASALFLLSEREGDNPALLHRAVEVFSDALAVYDKLGAEKMANVAHNNLKRAEKALAETERELEAKQNWLDDLLDDDAPLTFEKIELADDLKDE